MGRHAGSVHGIVAGYFNAGTYILVVCTCMFELMHILPFIMGKQHAQSAKGKSSAILEPAPKKRGRKPLHENLETLATNYVTGNSSAIRKEIHGLECDLKTDPEDLETEAEILDFISDPRNTRGRLTLFQQTVHTYWLVKCLIAKAIQSFNPGQARNEATKMDPRVLELLQSIHDQLHHIKITQYQAADRMNRLDDRVGHMEKQLQTLQQVDMPGSTVKDPAPVYSSDG